MSQPKSSRTFTTDYKVRSKDYSVWVYVAPSQLSAWKIKGNHTGWPKPSCLGTCFISTAKQLKSHGTTCIEFLSGYTHSNPSLCHLFKSIWTDQGHLVKSHSPHRPSSPRSLCLSLLSSGFVLFHSLEFGHFLFPGCPSSLQEGREVTEGSHCQFHQPNRVGGWTKQISIFWMAGSLSPPITSGLTCPWQGRTKT